MHVFNCSYRFIQVSSISYEIIKLYSHLTKKLSSFLKAAGKSVSNQGGGRMTKHTEQNKNFLWKVYIVFPYLLRQILCLNWRNICHCYFTVYHQEENYIFRDIL